MIILTIANTLIPETEVRSTPPATHVATSLHADDWAPVTVRLEGPGGIAGAPSRLKRPSQWYH